MNYYKQNQILALVDINDNIISTREKWETHKNGLLHRGFHVALMYNDSYILQHRKHPVFDGYFDITASSHPIYINDKLQDILSAIYDCLKREWYLTKKDLLHEPVKKGFFIYKAHNEKSGYTEHEVCYIYIAEVKKPPVPNYDFAYGFSIIKKQELFQNEVFKIFTPWVRECMKRKFI